MFTNQLLKNWVHAYKRSKQIKINKNFENCYCSSSFNQASSEKVTCIFEVILQHGKYTTIVIIIWIRKITGMCLWRNMTKIKMDQVMLIALSCE